MPSDDQTRSAAREHEMTEIPVALARAYRDLVAAARKYVPVGDAWSAWNNQDGHEWPELRAALNAVEEARRG